MCAKHVERHQAVELRKRGLSYSEIQVHVPVSQASLSLWLRGVGLTEAQAQRLADKKRAGNRAAAERVRILRLERIRRITEQAEREALSYLERREHLWTLGVALYWAEGTKLKARRTNDRFEFTNTDPAMLLLIRRWVTQYCAVSESDLGYLLYIHPDADISSAQRFWYARLNIPPGTLKTYLKRPNPSTRRHNSGSGYYGTIRLTVRRSTTLAHRIMSWIHTTALFCGVG